MIGHPPTRPKQLETSVRRTGWPCPAGIAAGASRNDWHVDRPAGNTGQSASARPCADARPTDRSRLRSAGQDSAGRPPPVRVGHGLQRTGVGHSPWRKPEWRPEKQAGRDGVWRGSVDSSSNVELDRVGGKKRWVIFFVYKMTK
jgi:hypothetical protein